MEASSTRRVHACARGSRILSCLPRSPSDHFRARVRGSFGRVYARSDRPHFRVRLGVVACLAAVIVLGTTYYVKAIDRLGADASRNAAANYDDRELGVVNAIGANMEVLNEARGWIPENGRYRLLVGTSSTDIDFRNYARYFLMPRRPAPDARWVLCYECDRSRFGSELDVVWEDNQGVLIGRLPA